MFGDISGHLKGAVLSHCEMAKTILSPLPVNLESIIRCPQFAVPRSIHKHTHFMDSCLVWPLANANVVRRYLPRILREVLNMQMLAM